jgi:hypothetical protein
MTTGESPVPRAMIQNATITRIDVLSGATAGGEPAFTTGAAVAMRCCISNPSSSQLYQMGSRIKTAEQVIYVYRADLIAAGMVAEPAAGTRIVVAQDDRSSGTWELETVRDWTHAAQSHVEMYVRRVV